MLKNWAAVYTVGGLDNLFIGKWFFTRNRLNRYFERIYKKGVNDMVVDVSHKNKWIYSIIPPEGC
jgi:hypothetical protein